MAKTVDLRTYIALEKAFQRRLLRSWRIQSAPTYAAITHACLDHKWDEARRLVTDLDMAEVGTENREWITYMLLSLGVFGANMVAKGKPSFVGVGSFDTFLKQTTNNILQYLEFNATAQIQAEALQSIAEDEAKTKAASLKVAFDPAQPRDKEGKWRREVGLGAGEYTAGKNRQVDTPAFKSWFKDSAIVTPEGEPLIAFHGTPSKGSESNNRWVRAEQADQQYGLIEEFDTEARGVTDSGWLGTGTYFTPDPDYAHEFGDRIMPVFLSIQKPFVVEDDSTNGLENQLRFLKSIQGMEGLPEELKIDLSMPQSTTHENWRDPAKPWVRVFELSKGANKDGQPEVYLLSRDSESPAGTGVVESRGSTAEAAIFAHRYKDEYNTFLLSTVGKIGARRFRDILVKNGYDGVIERAPGGKIPKEIVAFYPTQIKSALGNSGAFDPNDPRILKWDEAKHPRDKEGQFARSGTLRQPGEEPDDMEGGGPQRKKWSDLNTAVMAADDEFFAAKEAHLPHANRVWDRFVEETKPFSPDDTVNIAAVEERVFSDPEYLKTKAALKAAEMKQLDADAALKAQTPIMKIEVVTNLANSEAEKMGVSPWHINVVDKDPPSFMVGDKQFTEAGHYQPSNEQIEINVRDLSYGDASIVRGIVSHELSHFVWHTMKSVADREFQRYLAKAVTPDGQNHTAWYHERFGGVAGDVVIHSYRKLKPEYYEEMAKEFPASMALSGLSGGPANIFSGISAEMVKENGHSAYAKSYWTPEAVKSRNGSYDTAINETIAEVTRYLRHPKSWAYEEHTPSLDSPWVKMTSGMYTWHRARQARIKELVS